MATIGPLTRQRLRVAAGLAAQRDTRAIWQHLRLLRREALSRSEVARSFAGVVPRRAGAGEGWVSDPSKATVLLGLPFVIGGGAERMLSTVAGALVAGGHRVLAVTTRPTPFGYGDRSDWFARAGVELFDLPTLLPERDWLDFIDWLIEHERVDVLWQTGSLYLYRAVAELRRHHPQLRIVDSLFNTEVHIRRHLALSESVDVAIVESELVADALIQGGADRARLVTMPNGVDTARFRPRDCGAGGSARSERAVLNVGFVGRLAEEKDPLAFVDIASACRHLPMRFHVAGDGPLAGAVRRRARRRGLRESLRLHGFVENIVDLYDQLDTVIVPSRADGRPNVVLESLAMGVPVLASPVGAIPQLVRDGTDGFVCAGVPAFCERLQWLQAHPLDLQLMREAARSVAVKEFGASATHRRYERLISELVLGGGSSQRAHA